jgi:DNA modification methylase
MILIGDVLEQIKTIPNESVNCVITSPPYWNLRDYEQDGQLGLEPTPDEYVVNMVNVFREVRRVLANDGTFWLNIGDTYSNSHFSNIKPKDLIGIPWMLAFALRADGWYLRQDIIWSKPNPMPEPVKDRCTKSHEHIFLLTKSSKYYFDFEAIKEPRVSSSNNHQFGGKKYNDPDNMVYQSIGSIYKSDGKRNKRDVWSIPTQPFKESHFAVMPEALVKPCVLAGSKEGDTILDPFFGAGTTGLVALKNNRKYIGIELNPEYAKIAENRIRKVIKNDSQAN